MTSAAENEPSVSPFKAGLTCSCPRCGGGKLFAGYLTLAPRCETCGLDYAFADSGDGPAVFVILFGGLIAMIAVLVVELVGRHSRRARCDAAAAPLYQIAPNRAPVSSQGRRSAG
jgi:uncharacterized protein (DUF983 family)